MDYRTITSKRQFKDATSYNKADFLKLLKDYEDTYFDKYGKSYEKYIEENVLEIPKLKTLGDALFFVLFKLKNDMIWGSFGLVFNMSESAAHRNFELFLSLLEETLDKKK
ncbi:MAG TPA: transposase family protein [Phaeodactylibacter sp.]|nr:transposase family protein [Phaeodactylibacter sp.]